MKNQIKTTALTILLLIATAAAAQDRPFPEIAPADVTREMDLRQMMWQLGIEWPEMPDMQTDYKTNIEPKLVARGSDVRYAAKENGSWSWSAGTSSVATDYIGQTNTQRSPAGIWNNYIQSWEPAGSYFTGEEFYKPLPLHDLTGITPANWPGRRAKIFEEVQKIWGTIPEKADDIKIEWTEGEAETGTSAGYDYTQRTITGTLDVSDFPGLRNAPVISCLLRLPASAKGTKAPVIINIGMFRGMVDSVLWQSFASRGIGIVMYNNNALQPDNGAGLTSYLIGYVNRGKWRTPTDWGTLAAWSWGISRMIDYFEKSDEVDARKIGVTGHSRYGKAALVAMAYEERIAVGAPTSSGSLGAVQARRHWGQDLEHSLGAGEYHWMAGNFMNYAGVDPSSKDGYMPRKVLNMPVDAESLVALCAPRPFFVGAGSMNAVRGDAWADPYGEYLLCVAASPVYRMLGKRGVVMDDHMTYEGKQIPMPVYDKDYIDGDIAYRVHRGGHSARENFPAFAAFAARYLK
jgi:hypothetical protein